MNKNTNTPSFSQKINHHRQDHKSILFIASDSISFVVSDNAFAIIIKIVFILY